MSVVAITFTWWGGLSGWECTKVWPNKLGDGAGACQGEWVKKKGLLSRLVHDRVWVVPNLGRARMYGGHEVRHATGDHKTQTGSNQATLPFV